MKMNLWCFGSGAAQEMHRRWFESHLEKFNLSLLKIDLMNIHGLVYCWTKF